MSIRMALFHPLCAPKKSPPPSFSYKKHPSSKIDAFRKIIRHHLAERGRGPLRNAATEADPNHLRYAEEVKQPAGTEAIPNPDMPHDKIVAFVMFPENIDIVRSMLEEEGLEWAEYIGSALALTRSKKLKRFRTSKTCNILLCSKIGTTGLNMPFARIAVLIVRVPTTIMPFLCLPLFH